MVRDGMKVVRRANTIILLLMLSRRMSLRKSAVACSHEAKNSLPLSVMQRDDDNVVIGWKDYILSHSWDVFQEFLFWKFYSTGLSRALLNRL